jgi:hypothetical protein
VGSVAARFNLGEGGKSMSPTGRGPFSGCRKSEDALQKIRFVPIGLFTYIEVARERQKETRRTTMDAMMFAMLAANHKGHRPSTAEREIAEAIANYEETAPHRARAPKRGFLKGLGL